MNILRDNAMFIQSETQIEVRYYETDQMGIVHHSNYIRYFECGRHQFLIDVGLPIMELEKHGIMMPVVSVNAKYHTPARMGDVLLVVSRVEKEPMARIEVLTDMHSGPRLHPQRHPPSHPHPCRPAGSIPQGRHGTGCCKRK